MQQVAAEMPQTKMQQAAAKFDEANRQQPIDELGGAKWQRTKTITTMTHCPHKED